MNGYRDITENLKDTGTSLFYGAKEVILSLNMGRIFYVNATDGDDATAARGRFDKPYKTIQAACSAAALYTSGDIVEVMTGTYTENVSSIVSTGINLVLRGATVNGNINVNNNTNTGRLFLLQGSVVNGNINGTFGSATISDGTGIINGRIGTVGDNGGHYVKGLLKLSNTGDINANLGPNCTIEDIGTIQTNHDYNFKFGNNQDAANNLRNPIIRRIGLIRNTSANATARIFEPNEGLFIDTLQDVDLMECVNGSIYNDLFRNLFIYRCVNVTFKSRQQSFTGLGISGSFYDCKFICTFDQIMLIYESPTAAFTSLKFYNCHFQANAAVPNIISTHDSSAPKYIEIIGCVYNKATFWGGVQPLTYNTNFNSYVANFTIRTPKIV